MQLGYSFALALSALIGLSLGILGSGGSIITLPILVYVAMIPVNQAVGLSLVIVGGTAAVGSLLRVQQGEIALKPALLFAASGAVGAFLGSKLTHLISPHILLIFFGSLMIGVGCIMLRHGAQPSTNSTCRIMRCLTIGCVVGILTGFLGVGGGFLILPALVLFAGLEMKKAIGTSLLIIALNSGSALAGQLRFIHLNGPETFGFLAMAIIGMLIGLSFTKRLSSSNLKRGFAWSIIGLGTFLISKNLLDYLRAL